jgi:hypothetical protein
MLLHSGGVVTGSDAHSELSVIRVITIAVCATAALLFADARPLDAQTPPQRTIISIPGHAAPVLLDTIGAPKEVAGSPARAFAALVIAYQGLRIPVKVQDTVFRYVGNLHLTKMRELGGTPLSRYIECGNDMTGARADKYRVHLAIVSRIDSVAPDRSRLRSSVVAGAEDVMGNSMYPIPCGSTGALEARIADLVAGQAKKPE